ncbi:DUF4336 domain-containing protein [Mesobacterium pallidum]|uniref:DUF4336 domain-containing protein n=1 Tax=Mesobacterium pallidum TaxID=2872037 RepID=UPI001EE1F9ED|nr:DUF4336 domain-containing protein [Mesobacterium pallidum]
MQPFGPGIWIIDGPEVRVAGFPYATRMAVIRRAGGGLVLWSPIRFDAVLAERLAALGPVAHLVTPSASHNLALADWQRAFPQAQVHGPEGLRRKLPDLAGIESLASPGSWPGEINMVCLPNAIADEFWLFHRASGTLLVCDLLQQVPRAALSGWRAWVARLDLMTGDESQVPRKFRLAMRRGPARAALAEVLDWPVEAVVMAHGTPVTGDAPAFLRRAFRWL